MTPEAQRIAIARACGWMVGVPSDSGRLATCGSTRDNRTVRDLPDYLGSLDAMHEAEKVLPQDAKTQEIWFEWLKTGVCEAGASNLVVAACRAYAPMHAEAFLRTLGLWVEETE